MPSYFIPVLPSLSKPYGIWTHEACLFCTLVSRSVSCQVSWNKSRSSHPLRWSIRTHIDVVSALPSRNACLRRQHFQLTCLHYITDIIPKSNKSTLGHCNCRQVGGKKWWSLASPAPSTYEHQEKKDWLGWPESRLPNTKWGYIFGLSSLYSISSLLLS